MFPILFKEKSRTKTSTIHTYPGLYLGKKKCAWKMTLITFLKWQVDNLNLEFKKNLSRDFWKNAIWSFLLYKAESDLKEKSVNKVPFEASYCQNDSKMWYSKENLRKKCLLFYKIFLLCVRKSKNPILTIKSVFYSENRFFTLPDAKKGNS